MSISMTNPVGAPPPIGKYSLVASVPAGRTLLYLAGQVGNLPDLTLAGPDTASQARQVFANIEAILDEVGARPHDFVKLMTFVAGPDNVTAFLRVRDEVFARWFPVGRYPPHTLVVVVALTRPEFLVEVEAILAVPDPAGSP